MRRGSCAYFGGGPEVGVLRDCYLVSNPRTTSANSTVVSPIFTLSLLCRILLSEFLLTTKKSAPLSSFSKVGRNQKEFFSLLALLKHIGRRKKRTSFIQAVNQNLFSLPFPSSPRIFPKLLTVEKLISNKSLHLCMELKQRKL